MHNDCKSDNFIMYIPGIYFGPDMLLNVLYVELPHLVLTVISEVGTNIIFIFTMGEIEA